MLLWVHESWNSQNLDMNLLQTSILLLIKTSIWFSVKTTRLFHSSQFFVGLFVEVLSLCPKMKDRHAVFPVIKKICTKPASTLLHNVVCSGEVEESTATYVEFCTVWPRQYSSFPVHCRRTTGRGSEADRGWARESRRTEQSASNGTSISIKVWAITCQVEEKKTES